MPAAARSKLCRYPAKTTTDADYADDIALLANTPNQAKTQDYRRIIKCNLKTILEHWKYVYDYRIIWFGFVAYQQLLVI